MLNELTDLPHDVAQISEFAGLNARIGTVYEVFNLSQNNDLADRRGIGRGGG
jgi:hypothetical protein